MPALDRPEAVIEVENVFFCYNGQEVLRDIHLAVLRGDYLALVGSNGSGKTTLLKIILGLLSPSAGSVRLFGKKVHDFNEGSKIGYVPQKATHIDSHFPATVREVALMGRYGRRGLFHRVRKEDREKTEEALARVGMSDFQDRLIGDLSGGQQQRVFIARALASEPELLLLDEPTAGIDKEMREDFYALLRNLNRELGLTIFLVTHDLERIAHERMHVACIDQTLFFHHSVESFFKETKPVHLH